MQYVACYCRVSHEEQVKFGFSIQAQKDALEKYCKQHGYKYEFYIDEGISASSMKKRKALNEMLEKCNVFDMIIFTKLDRLSRNVLDANNINQLLINNKCTMKAIDEDDVDTSTADGTFIFNLKVSLAQREIEKTSERIKFVFQSKRNKGEITSGTVKYGYKIVDKKYVINEPEAENIRNLYQYYIKTNANYEETYKYFIEHFPGKGKDALSNYLRDTAYIGKYKLYRKDVYIDNYIPPIVDKETFDKVQQLHSKRPVYNNRNKTLDIFSGLIFCDECKRRMCKKADYRVKNCVIRYACDYRSRVIPGTNKRKCNNHTTIREDHIEKYLLDNLQDTFEKYKVKVKVKASPVKKDNSSDIKKIKNKINKLKDLYLDDLIDKETYEIDYKKYTQQLAKLEIDITEVKERDFSKIEKILNSDYINVYNKLTKENKKRFWLSIIDKIYFSDGKIKEITFL